MPLSAPTPSALGLEHELVIIVYKTSVTRSRERQLRKSFLKGFHSTPFLVFNKHFLSGYSVLGTGG